MSHSQSSVGVVKNHARVSFTTSVGVVKTTPGSHSQGVVNRESTRTHSKTLPRTALQPPPLLPIVPLEGERVADTGAVMGEWNGDIGESIREREREEEREKGGT
jgi:hypothetical protein